MMWSQSELRSGADGGNARRRSGTVRLDLAGNRVHGGVHAVLVEQRHADQIVRQDLLRDGRDADEHIADVEHAAQHRQQLVERFEPP